MHTKRIAYWSSEGAKQLDKLLANGDTFQNLLSELLKTFPDMNAKVHQLNILYSKRICALIS